MNIGSSRFRAMYNIMWLAAIKQLFNAFSAKAFLIVTCADDTHWVFADGRWLGNLTINFGTAQTLTVPANTRILAVQVKNAEFGAGFGVIFVDNRFIKLPPWKCWQGQRQPLSGWRFPEFDDKDWAPPLVHSSASAATCRGFTAAWMWTEATFSTLKTIYCRLHLGNNR